MKTTKKLLGTLLIISSMLFTACESDADDLQETAENLESETQVEVASEIPGELVQMYFGGQEVFLEKLGEKYIYQGDIMLSPDMVSDQPQELVIEKRHQIKATGRTSRFWTNNTVYYSINPELRNKTRIKDAINHWESHTKLKFVERTTQANYIYFDFGSGCSSYVGMIGGKQIITASACSTGSIIHEIGHAVGLFHEQARMDRDQFVKINWHNIAPGREHNFQTYAQMRMKGQELTSYLDFNSIMLYDSYSFSKNRQPTIVRNDGSTFRGQREGLSHGDILGVDNMYPNSGVPTYTNGATYYIFGLTVLRQHDYWYFRTKYGWKRVRLINERWYWV